MCMARESDNSGVFWGEISPCDHLVQLYEDDAVLLDTLCGYVAGGLSSGEGVVVIATPAHREALAARLAHFSQLGSFALDAAIARDQYIVLDAAETLAQFMRDDRPDPDLFRQVVTEILARARGQGSWGGEGRRVRAFGEMVALMWAEGHCGATVQLEHLWHDLCREKAFSLFCAYPKCGFTQDAGEGLAEICAAHSRVIPG